MSIRVGLRSMGRALGEIIIDEWRKAANIFSADSLCSSAPEELTVMLVSLVTLSIAEVRLTASPPEAVASLCTLDGEVLTPILASVVDLSTAPT